MKGLHLASLASPAIIAVALLQVATVGATEAACQGKCLRGNWNGAGWATFPDSPACWKNEGSYFSCFDKVNGNCPWGGMTDCSSAPTTAPPTPTPSTPTSAPTPTPTTAAPTPSSSKNPTEKCWGVCLRANNKAYGWASASSGAPPCWKDEGTYYSCFDYKDGKCPWGGMTDCPNTEKPLCDGWGAYCGKLDCINPARRGCCYNADTNSYFSFWWYINGQPNDECKAPLIRS